MEKILKTKITNIGDPFILVYESVYYHYSTSSNEGFKVFISNDLINWEDKGLCYHHSKVGYECFWAPEVYYLNDEFYMLFTSRNIDTGYLTLSLAKATSALGIFKDLSDKPTFDFGYAAIDGHLFKDDDGTIYMFYAKDCSLNIVDGNHISQIYGVKLKNDLVTLDGEPILISTPTEAYEGINSSWQWNEGPFVLKNNGIYYLSYSTNMYLDKKYCVCYSTSSNPLGPYVKSPNNPILKYIDNVISGPGHNAYFRANNNSLMTSYHIHTNIDEPSGDRTTCFSKVFFKDNNLIIDYK
ncbi:MAG: glycoside hydrolase family 43 protein [Acholeplasmatales bacterium]|nr:glycoside hydrolase family 43 protein [Acholeplasmatales bacterium]